MPNIKSETRVEVLRQKMDYGVLYTQKEIAKLLHLQLKNYKSTLKNILTDVTFIMPELYETDKGLLGIICY